MLREMIQATSPALGLTEAVLMPALPQFRRTLESPRVYNNYADHFVSVSQSIETTPAASNRRGSVAGRAVLSARGIQLPSATAMRSMACAARGTPGMRTIPVNSLIEQSCWG